jgi:hypothetical protein
MLTVAGAFTRDRLFFISYNIDLLSTLSLPLAGG